CRQTREEAKREVARKEQRLAQPKSAEALFVHQLRHKTLGFLGHDALSAKIQERATALAPANPPVRFPFRRGEMFIRDGSRYLAAGRAEKRIVDATAGPVVDFRPSPDGRKFAYGLQTRGN